MNIPRVGHASFALSGRIYVVGGMDGKVPKTAKTSMSWVILLGFFGWSMSMVKCLKIQEVLKMCVEFFFLSLVFSYTSSLTSTSPVVPLPPLTGFLSPICRFALVLEVVLDTYEAYDIEKKCWLPPQRLGIYAWGGKREETKIATEISRVQKDVHLQTVWFPLLYWNIGG